MRYTQLPEHRIDGHDHVGQGANIESDLAPQFARSVMNENFTAHRN